VKYVVRLTEPQINAALTGLGNLLPPTCSEEEARQLFGRSYSAAVNARAILWSALAPARAGRAIAKAEGK
jgi:hypothetical protein